jgi:hypothetical protein
VANRFKARAYDLLAELCLRTGTPNELVAPEAIAQIETAVRETDLETALDKNRWKSYFERGFDVYGEIFAFYAERAGVKGIDPRRLDSLGLVPRPEAPVSLTTHDARWVIFYGIFTAEEASQRCAHLNRIHLYAGPAQWKLPARNEIGNLQALLDGLPYHSPGMYVVWTSGGATSLEERPAPAGGFAYGAVACRASR